MSDETLKIRAQLRSELRIINNDNPAIIRDEVISDWEGMTNKKLYPAQSDNFMLNELAAREASTKAQVNEALLQQYVRTASGTFLEELGYFWGVTRIIETIPDPDDVNKPIELMEDDERFRRRILLAPEAITNAGTIGAYTFHALGAHLAIRDVDISTPDDGAGKVHITVLGDNSVAIEELIDAVYHAITDEKVKVLCVAYSVSAPEIVHYDLKVEVTIYEHFTSEAVKKAVIKELEFYASTPRKNQSIDEVNSIAELPDRYRILGVDIVESQVVDAIHNVPGVYKAQIISLPEGGVIPVLSGDDHPFGSLIKIAEHAVCGSIEVTIVGSVHG